MPAAYANIFWRSEKDAAELLIQNKVIGAHLVRIGTEAILFSSGKKDEEQAWTAWLSDDRRSIVRLDRGFPAEF